MRKARKARNAILRNARFEPMEEGTIPLDKQGRRNWASLSDEKLVSYAKTFMKERGITGRKEFEKADNGLYLVLRKRRLLDRVGFEEKQRLWQKMKDEEIIGLAKKLMKEKKISKRSGLQKADPGMYTALRKRKLVGKVGFEEKRRPWKGMDDEQIIEFARKFMKENGICGKKELQKADNGFYGILMRRGLLDRVGFEEKRRPWKGINDEEIVELAKKLMKEKGISGRSELQNADHGLYLVLMRKGLLERIRFKEKLIYWKEMKTQEIIEYAKRYMKENGIRWKGELFKASSGLYHVLRKRKLLDSVGFEKKKREERPWKEMDEEEVIEFAKSFLKEKGIKGRTGLYMADPGLYQVLRKRNLLNLLFEDLDRSKEAVIRQGLLAGLAQAADAMERFGEQR